MYEIVDGDCSDFRWIHWAWLSGELKVLPFMVLQGICLFYSSFFLKTGRYILSGFSWNDF